MTRTRALLAVLLLVLVAALAACADDMPEAPPDPAATVPLTTKVDSADADRKPDATVKVPEAAAHEVAKSEAGDHANERNEAPSGVTPAQLAAAKDQQASLFDPALPFTAPLAAPYQAGCTYKGVRNYSSRNGVRPRVIVMHYTVSANRPGWGDVDANVSWFNSSAAQASSNYVIDAEGHCAYIVPESSKAWAQATFNPVALSIEVVNTGHESSYAGTAGLAKIGRVVHDMAKRWGIPLQTGAVSGCTVTRSGVVTHHQLGACGGGHFDIDPFELGSVISAAKAAGGTSSGSTSSLGVLLKGERAYADALLFERRVAKRHGGWDHVDPSHLANAVKAKNGLRRANERLHETASKTGWGRVNRRERHALIHALV